jgi:hypothetical protein
MKLVESATILALVTGVLYLFGYIYFESFYTFLGIDYMLVALPFERLLTYGSLQLMQVILIALSVSCLACFIPKNKFTVNILLFPKSPLVALSLLTFFISVVVLSANSAKNGRDAAKDYLSGDCQLMTVSVKDHSDVHGCLLPNKAGDIWLLPLSADRSSVDKELVIIPKGFFSKLETHSNSQSINKSSKVDAQE